MERKTMMVLSVLYVAQKSRVLRKPERSTMLLEKKPSVSSNVSYLIC